MEKNVSGILAVIAVLCLLVGAIGGGLIGYASAPEKTVTNEVIKEVPTTITETITETIEVEVADTSLILDDAVGEFYTELEDRDKWLRCDGYEYDIDEIETSKIYDYYTIFEDDEIRTVNFKIKLKYDEDDERSCRRTFEPEVTWEEDEDVVVRV